MRSTDRIAPGERLGWVAAVIIALAWALLPAGPATPVAEAQAQIPNAGAQRAVMIEQLQAANRQLAEIRDLLRDMREASIDKPPAGPQAAPTSAPADRD